MCEGLPVLVLRARLPGNFTARGVRGRKRISLHCVLRRAARFVWEGECTLDPLAWET